MTDLTNLENRFPRLGKLIRSEKRFEETTARLIAEDQATVFEKYLASADDDVLKTFLAEAANIDWAHIQRHRETLKRVSSESAEKVEYDPLKTDLDQHTHAEKDRQTGWESLARGEWAVTVFAGGAGTRFFTEWPKVSEAMPVPCERLRTNPPDSNDPKGLFPISPVMGWSFIQRIMAEILETGVRCGTMPPAMFMTSRVTHERTAAWLDTDPLWGFPKQAARLFKQTEIPRLDETGDLIVKPDGTLFWTGNGHGGIYGALGLKGQDGHTALDVLTGGNVKHIVMGNVDNAALHPLDPKRLGYHIRTNSKMTLSVVKRTDPNEKVGMTAKRRHDGKIEVIEYSVLDPELSASPDDRGGLLFDGAHINTNLLDIQAIRTDLPGTLYTKKPVAVGDRKVDSSTYELLNQHLASLIEPKDVHVYEGTRAELFMPTKAVLGQDSVQSTFATLTQEAAALLHELGAAVAGSTHSPAAYAEFHPCLGLTRDELAERGVGAKWELTAGSRLYLGVRHPAIGAVTYGSRLHLQEGATLILDAEKPYGKLTYNPETRALTEHPESAGRLTLGSNVVLKPGVRVVVRIKGSGKLVIPDGTVFSNHLELTVNPGETLTIGD